MRRTWIERRSPAGGRAGRRGVGLLGGLLLGLTFSLALTGCGTPQYQFEKSQNQEKVALAITPYPQTSLTPIHYTLQVSRDGQPVQQAVEVEFKMPKMDMGSHVVQAQPQGKKGLYTLEQTLSMPGDWQILVRTGGEEFAFDTVATAGQASAKAMDGMKE
ncbi:FixH family protein [Desulfosporosinus sp. PR]|uniref:FixH family protein n=1 Tax=Candidatus Desulfosporosinus nitrosoreducens TaxID=3401928 RepID=UPI0027EDF018|nr:FixH family protein [Desulfosporosinus sp. PR]MDQ7097058.1 FixH family protein [Desulfosporosinus sp. PR]